MKLLKGNEEKEALKFIDEAAKIALNSSCERSKCGSVIVKEGEIIGKGYNSPAGNFESQRRCSCDKNKYHKKVTDKTCCVHAEQRAIMDVLKFNGNKIENSRLYFIRLDENNKKSEAGKPYCTICSKMALDAGVKEFVLLHKEGITVYDTEEYNALSYEYDE